MVASYRSARYEVPDTKCQIRSARYEVERLPVFYNLAGFIAKNAFAALNEVSAYARGVRGHNEVTMK